MKAKQLLNLVTAALAAGWWHTMNALNYELSGNGGNE